MPGLRNEVIVFGYALITGMMAMNMYYVLCLFRKIVRHSMRMVGVEDLIFWIGISVFFYRQMYITTYGSIRWYFALGIVGGAILCILVKNKLKKSVENIRKSLEKKYENN